MATYEDFAIDQGADIALELELVDTDGSVKNLTGHSVNAKLKRNYNSDVSETLDFTSVIADPPTDGIVVISLSNIQTDSLSSRGRYVYDVELSYVDEDGATMIERILEGKIKVNPSVTR
jgi:hypothetical protein